MASNFLRVRLSPPLINPTPAQSRTSNRNFTPISLNQALLAAQLPDLAKTWSRAPTMGEQLVQAVASDLDTQLANVPALGDDLRQVVDELRREWSMDIDNRRSRQYEGNEHLTHNASKILLDHFVYQAFHAIQCHLRPTALDEHDYQWKQDHQIESCKVDNTVFIDDNPVVLVEDKRLTDLPRVLEEVKMRASVLGKVDIKVTDKAPVQDWSTVVNKGALYQQAYKTDFVLFFSITAVLVGYRTGTSLLWSDPIYNRRNDGNEFEPSSTPDAAQTTMDALLLVFGGVTAGPTKQTGIPLLFLAAVLKGAMKYAPWLQQSFPSLSGVQFNAADRDPILKQQAGQYTGTGMKKEDIEKANKRSGDKSGDYKPTKGAHALAPNTLWSGQRSFAGDWYGELADPVGYSVTIVQPLSHGSHGVVYAGQLWQAGFPVSEVAIKVSDDAETLRAELAIYEELKDVMGHYIPRCYGVLVVDNGAFLVTELLESRDTIQSQHERAAIYEALSKLHEAGWMHNDIVAAGSALRNLVWARSGHAVLIDLVTASRHNCHGTCDELEGARNVLQLPEPRIIV
ncbi:hypothetical protein B0H13DRAFT_1971601 [Mycena leptocephala]|nr:hypothetical protein B0H13DRAFT_1971601 [Mycena leptocephala]